jgi:hypothetical protein
LQVRQAPSCGLSEQDSFGLTGIGNLAEVIVEWRARIDAEVIVEFSLIGDKALLVGVVLVVAGPIVVHTTMRSMLIRERGDWRTGIEDAAEE